LAAFSASALSADTFARNVFMLSVIAIAYCFIALPMLNTLIWQNSHHTFAAKGAEAGEIVLVAITALTICHAGTAISIVQGILLLTSSNARSVPDFSMPSAKTSDYHV
jgi:hypothetical protein